MSSILIYQGTAESREQKARSILEGYILHEVKSEKGKIGIAPIRDLIPHLSVKPPAGKKRGVLILEAQQLTPEAQNALLKTLEEPPTYVTFVLTAPNPKLLLPTVTSRCALVKAEDGETEKVSPQLEKFLQMSPAKRLNFFEKEIGYEGQAALNFLEELENAWRKKLPDLQAARALKKIWETKKNLRTPTTNIKIAVDEYLLSW